MFIEGTSGPDSLLGTQGDDFIIGNGGRDTIFGGEGDDDIVVVANREGIADIVDGGSGFDFVSFVDLPRFERRLVLQQNADGTIQFSGDEPVILRNVESVIFFGPSDSIDASALSTGIEIIGGFGDIITGSGNDLIRVTSGLTQNGLPISTGGGADIIRFEEASFFGGLTELTITDFSSNDVIDLDRVARRFDFGPVMTLLPIFIGAEAFTGRGGEFRFERRADETLLLFDGDGDTESDFTLTLAGSFDLERLSIRSIQSFFALRIARSTADQGTDGNNRLLGTLGDDTILGLDGNDSLEGRGGADLLDGGAGEDLFFVEVTEEDSEFVVPSVTLIGGEGRDLVVVNVASASDVASPLRLVEVDGQVTFSIDGVSEAITAQSIERFQINASNRDIVAGNVTRDIIVNLRVASGIQATLTTGNGDDFLRILTNFDASAHARTGQGNDTLNGSVGSETLIGGAGSDRLFGQDSDDFLDGGVGRDNVSGGRGEDTLIGGGNFDTLFGRGGNDIISGGSGGDEIFGDDGDDLIDAGGGFDTVEGDDGNDTVFGAVGRDSIRGGEGDDSLDGGGNFDTISGGDGVDTISGGSGADDISGDGGDDDLRGDGGFDTLDGGLGNDFISGGVGADQIDGGDGDDLLLGESNLDTINGGAGNDTLEGGSGADDLSGGDDNDLVRGDGGFDVVSGGAGNDRLFGGVGNDTLKGGDGNDILNGNSGADIIDGGAGNDLLFGGNDDDIFQFTDGFGEDTIQFFSTDAGTLTGRDRIDLSMVTGITDFADLVANHLSETGGDAVVAVGANTITLIGVSVMSVTMDDFIF